MGERAGAEGTDADGVRDLFAVFGPVQVRRLFGGLGIYADGIMFALVAGGALFLKADPPSVAAFEAEGCEPFTYGSKSGTRTIKSYWRVPDRLLDDSDEFAQWAHRALAAARAAATPRPRQRSSL